MRPTTLHQEKRILIIVIGGMGDCLLFDPLFRRLKEKWPDARIDVLSGCFKEMWERLDSVDGLMFFTPDRLKTPWAYARLFRTIYRSRYDIVAEGIAMIPMRGIYPVFTSLIFQASKAPIRIGRRNTGRYAMLRPRYSGFIGRAEMSEMARIKADGHKTQKNHYLTHVIDPPPPHVRQDHESSYIFQPLGISYHRKNDEPRLQSDPPLDFWAENVLRSHWSSGDEVIIGFTVETTRQIKSWPIEYFVSVLEYGVRDNMKFVMLGLRPQPNNSPFNRFCHKNLLDLSGKTNLGEMISLIRQCDFFFSCDTGPAHVAQACSVPTIVLFGPSNEREFGPINRELHTLVLPPEDMKCRPCVLGPCLESTSCVHSITPEMVYGEIIQNVLQYSKHTHRNGYKSIVRPETLVHI